MKVEGSTLNLHPSTFNLPDAWIRARGGQVAAETRRLMDDYQYGEAGKLIYDFAWGDVCDWYIELSKLSQSPETIRTLIWSLDLVLRLLHPFMPFVTEELWQHLKQTVQEKPGIGSAPDLPDLSWPALMLAPYPDVGQTACVRSRCPPPMEPRPCASCPWCRT